MRPEKKEALAKWIKSLFDKQAQDSTAQLAESSGKVYLTSLGDKYAADLRKLSDALLEEGGGATSYRAITSSKEFLEFS